MTAKIFRAVLVGLFAYASLIVGVRLMNAGPASPPDALRQIDPYSGVVEIRARLSQHVQNSTSAPDANRLGKELARQSPLDPAPYTLALLAQISAGDFTVGEDKIRHLKWLNPRHRVAHFIEAQLHLEKNRPNEALASFERLVVLDRSGEDQYLDGMVEVVLSTGSIDGIEALLKGRPDWGARFLRKFSEKSDNVRALQRLYKYYPANQSSFVRAVAKTGDYERAYIAFLSFLSSDEFGSITVPYDAKFDGLPGAKPFNWTFNEKFAEIDRKGGLFVNYFGRERPTILEQVTVLSPGDYSFNFNMRGELYQYGGSFEWIVQCIGQREPVIIVPISSLEPALTQYEARFAIPGTDCNFQRLRMRGMPGEYPRTSRVEIDSVKIAPLEELVE